MVNFKLLFLHIKSRRHRLKLLGFIILLLVISGGLISSISILLSPNFVADNLETNHKISQTKIILSGTSSPFSQKEHMFNEIKRQLHIQFDFNGKQLEKYRTLDYFDTFDTNHSELIFVINYRSLRDVLYEYNTSTLNIKKPIFISSYFTSGSLNISVNSDIINYEVDQIINASDFFNNIDHPILNYLRTKSAGFHSNFLILPDNDFYDLKTKWLYLLSLEFTTDFGNYIVWDKSGHQEFDQFITELIDKFNEWNIPLDSYRGNLVERINHNSETKIIFIALTEFFIIFIALAGIIMYLIKAKEIFEINKKQDYYLTELSPKKSSLSVIFGTELVIPLLMYGIFQLIFSLITISLFNLFNTNPNLAISKYIDYSLNIGIFMIFSILTVNLLNFIENLSFDIEKNIKLANYPTTILSIMIILLLAYLLFENWSYILGLLFISTIGLLLFVVIKLMYHGFRLVIKFISGKSSRTDRNLYPVFIAIFKKILRRKTLLISLMIPLFLTLLVVTNTYTVSLYQDSYWNLGGEINFKTDQPNKFEQDFQQETKISDYLRTKILLNDDMGTDRDNSPITNEISIFASDWNKISSYFGDNSISSWTDIDSSKLDGILLSWEYKELGYTKGDTYSIYYYENSTNSYQSESYVISGFFEKWPIITDLSGNTETLSFVMNMNDFDALMNKVQNNISFSYLLSVDDEDNILELYQELSSRSYINSISYVDIKQAIIIEKTIRLPIIIAFASFALIITGYYGQISKQKYKNERRSLALISLTQNYTEQLIGYKFIETLFLVISSLMIVFIYYMGIALPLTSITLGGLQLKFNLNTLNILSGVVVLFVTTINLVDLSALRGINAAQELRFKE